MTTTIKSSDGAYKSSSDWTSKIVESILAGRSQNAIENFKKQPIANKLNALENAIVPARRSDTADKVYSIIQELVRIGAITNEEAAPVFSDLLIRVHKYNSTNVQSNLDVLVNDIRAAQSEAIRNTDLRSLSNQTILNEFFENMYKTVPLGQHNFIAFKQTLRLFVNEAPNCTVFKSGKDTMLQVNIRGVNTVNLNAVFKNLYNYWGVTVDGDILPSNITSKLEANTRVLILFLAPFTNESTFSPDSFISALFNIYRDTLSASNEIPEETESEIQNVARSVGGNSIDLSNTLGYLIKNVNGPVKGNKSLTPRQENVLRYVQESLIDRIDRNGEEPHEALDNIQYSFAPSYYEQHGSFIRRLITYMQLALRTSPSYFREIYANKYWMPPQSFWTNNYSDFYIDMQNSNDNVNDDDFVWDEFATATPGTSRSQSVLSIPASIDSSLTSSSINPYAANTAMFSTLAKTAIPQIASIASDYYWPGSSSIAAPLAAAITTAALAPETKRRIKRIREQRARERVRMRLRRIREANDDAESTDSDDYVIKPLLGDGVKKNLDSEVHMFSHLAPKRGK
nr:IIIa [Tern adenovirus]